MFRNMSDLYQYPQPLTQSQRSGREVVLTLKIWTFGKGRTWLFSALRMRIASIILKLLRSNYGWAAL